MDITPDIHVKAEEKSLFELVTLLVDNANKYCDPEGTVTVRLHQIGRTRKRARLEVSNTYKDGKAVDYSKFFERFYRIEESHNNKNIKVLVLASLWLKAWSNYLKVVSLPLIKMTPSLYGHLVRIFFKYLTR